MPDTDIMAQMKLLLAEQHGPVPDGFELVAVESANWRLETGTTCAHGRCSEPCVAALNRRRQRPGRYGTGTRTVDAWYRYCLNHLHGNWIEDGKVMHWILREVKAGA